MQLVTMVHQHGPFLFKRIPKQLFLARLSEILLHGLLALQLDLFALCGDFRFQRQAALQSASRRGVFPLMNSLRLSRMMRSVSDIIRAVAFRQVVTVRVSIWTMASAHGTSCLSMAWESTLRNDAFEAKIDDAIAACSFHSVSWRSLSTFTLLWLRPFWDKAIWGLGDAAWGLDIPPTCFAVAFHHLAKCSEVVESHDLLHEFFAVTIPWTTGTLACLLSQSRFQLFHVSSDIGHKIREDTVDLLHEFLPDFVVHVAVLSVCLTIEKHTIVVNKSLHCLFLPPIISREKLCDWRLMRRYANLRSRAQFRSLNCSLNMSLNAQCRSFKMSSVSALCHATFACAAVDPPHEVVQVVGNGHEFTLVAKHPLLGFLCAISLVVLISSAFRELNVALPVFIRAACAAFFLPSSGCGCLPILIAEVPPDFLLYIPVLAFVVRNWKSSGIRSALLSGMREKTNSLMASASSSKSMLLCTLSFRNKYSSSLNCASCPFRQLPWAGRRLEAFLSAIATSISATSCFVAMAAAESL
jgi:hypothetical protein